MAAARRPSGEMDPVQVTLSLRAQLKSYAQFAGSVNSTLKDVNQIHTELDVEMKPINLVKGRLDRSYDLVGEQTAEELKRIDAAIETLDQLLKVPTAIAPSPAPSPAPPPAAVPTPTGNKRGPYKKRIRPDGSTSSAPSPSNSSAPSPAAYPSHASPSASHSIARSGSTTSLGGPFNTKPIAPAPPSHQPSPAPLGSKKGGSKSGSRKDLLAAQLPLSPGRQVAFRQPVKGPGGQEIKGKEEWILARILSVMDKNRYVVEDVDYDPMHPTADGGKYQTTLRSIVPLPDRRNPSLTYPDHDYSPGTQVMALYPDTTSFYRAVIVGGPVTIGAVASKKKDKDKPQAYRLRFDDDDNNVREVAVELVVEIP